MSGYEIDKKLIGTGVFGLVYLCRQKDTNQLMAQKVIKVAAWTNNEITQLLKEVKLLEKFLEYPHRNIIAGKGYMYVDDTFCIYMEYCDRGSLADDIKSRQKENRLYDEATLLDYAHQIASGVAHMHQHRVIHRDLKPANILITGVGVIKLADFGLGALLSSDSSLRASLVGTPLYMAPEIYNEEEYNFSCDIWAFGATLYELMALKPAFMARNQPATMRKIVSVEYNPLDNSYSEPLKGLVKLTLVFDPSKRPDSSSIASLKFLSDRNVDASSMRELDALLSKKAKEREQKEEKLQQPREAEEKKRVEEEEGKQKKEIERQRRKKEELERQRKEIAEKRKQQVEQQCREAEESKQREEAACRNREKDQETIKRNFVKELEVALDARGICPPAKPACVQKTVSNPPVNEAPVIRPATTKRAQSVECNKNAVLTRCHPPTSRYALKLTTDEKNLIKEYEESQHGRGSALHRASYEGQTSVVTLLIQDGAKVNHKNTNGQTPLHLASETGRLMTAEVLIKAGASINAQNISGRTPLHEACTRGESCMSR